MGDRYHMLHVVVEVNFAIASEIVSTAEYLCEINS